MPRMDVAALTAMCERIDALGGDHAHPEIAARFLPIEPAFETAVDQTLDPFSEAYHDRQVALYREIAGRELDQETGELHALDTGGLVDAPNPLGLRDVRLLSEQVRLTATMLSLAELPDGARVLDMGSGPGFGAEIEAFAGCRVHAVDIDAHLGDPARRRAAARGLDIVRSDLNYDDLGAIEAGAYDAAFFQASLHHSLRPWLLLRQVAAKLRPGGVIAFAAEPIQAQWWRHWGLRLDVESLYVARARGWFESGWSHGFLRDCFDRAGLRLAYFTGGEDGGEIGVAAAEPSRLDAARARAVRLGLREVWTAAGTDFPETAFSSACGERQADIPGGAGYRQTKGAGALVYGPYATLPAGLYEATAIVARDRDVGVTAGARLEIVAARGAKRLARVRLSRWRGRGPALLIARFALAEETPGVELRVRVRGNLGWTSTIPMLRRIDRAAAPA